MDNNENEERLIKHFVHVRYKFTKQFSSPDEAVDGLHARLVEDAGSSRSMIISPMCSGFFVTLTEEQAKKLAENECVREVRPAYTFMPRKRPQGLSEMVSLRFL
ncbi:uncharacterized protein LOC141594028 [Silene latifolia]|uniref:uncharacterized protein LOC141594028 n=1 Tax=Silene latifolia TaxID=37657 RepID=UPI003D76F998